MDVPTTFSAHVLCVHYERFDAKALAQRRQQPLLWRGQSLSSAALKHVDEQSYAALLVVIQAIVDAKLQDYDFSEWGVVGAPRFIGRAGLEPHLRKFFAEGPWSVTPHAIPHRCLHSPSGLISQLLGWHGANVGAGGGLTSVGEAFLTAMACLSSDTAGLWLVLSAYEPERLPECVSHAPPWQLEVLALALTPHAEAGSRGWLEIVPASAGSWKQNSVGDAAIIGATEAGQKSHTTEGVGYSLESASALNFVAEALSGPEPVSRCWLLGSDLTLRWTPQGGWRRDRPHDASRLASDRIGVMPPRAMEAEARAAEAEA